MAKMLTYAETREFCLAAPGHVRMAAAILIAEGDETLLAELELKAVEMLRLLGWARPTRDELEQVVKLARDGHEDGLLDAIFG